MRAAFATLALLAATGVAQPAFRASTAAQAGGGLVLPRPAGVVAGDVLVTVLYVDFETSTIAPDVAWSLIDDQQSFANRFHAAWYLRVATASEPGEYTFGTAGVGPFGSSALMLAFSGVEGASPVVSFASAATPTGQGFFPAPSLSPGPGHLHLFSVVYDGAYDPAEWSTPPGTLALGNLNTVTAFSTLVPSAGATAALVTTPSTGPPRSSGFVSSIALRSAADGGVPTFKARSQPTLSLAMPAGTKAGDLLLLGLHLDSYSAEVPADAGWALVEARRADMGSFHSGWLYRVVGPSEGATTQLPVKNVGADGAATVLTAWSGVDLDQPFTGVVSSFQPGPTFKQPLLAAGSQGVQLFGVSALEGQSAWSSPAGTTLLGSATHQALFAVDPGSPTPPSTSSAASDVAVVTGFILNSARVDAGAPDAGVGGGLPDAAGAPDAGTRDSGASDAGAGEANDAGSGDGGTQVSDGGATQQTREALGVGCGCGASPAGTLLTLLLAFPALRRRRG